MEEGEQRRGDGVDREATASGDGGAAETIPPCIEEGEVEDPGWVRGPDASQPFVRTQHPESKDNAGNRSRPSPSGIRLQGGGPPCAHGVLASVGQALWQASRPVPAAYHPLPRDPGTA